MGWWKVRDSDDIVGDDVFSTLRTAAKQVAELYSREFGRMPSSTEWERLMSEALEPVDDGGSMFSEGGRPVKVTIERGGNAGGPSD
jgi:hypothetical protein